MIFDCNRCRLDIDLDLELSIALDHTSWAWKVVCIEKIKKQSHSLGLNKINRLIVLLLQFLYLNVYPSYNLP